MALNNINEKLNDIVGFYRFGKKYDSPYIDSFFKQQVDEFVEEYSSDEDIERVNGYFSFNKLSQFTIGLAEMVFMVGAGFVADEYLTPEPYGLITACTLGGLECVRRICKTMNYLSVENFLDDCYKKKIWEKHGKSMDSLSNLFKD